MRKKLFSLALALALCLGLTVPAFAAELKIVEVPVPTVEEYEGEGYSTRSFREGLAPFILSDVGVGFIDWEGKVVIPPEYDTVWDFSEGFARVEKNDKMGFIDKTGKEITSLQYDNAAPFSEGLAAVMKNNKIGFVDTTGKEVIPCAYSDSAAGFSQGLAAVEKDGKWGFIDKTGEVAIDFTYDDAYSFSQGLAAVQKGSKWGYIDKAGEVVVDFTYDEVGGFAEGLARVKQGGKYGFIDKTGELVIPCTFDVVGYFSDGLAVVKQNGKYGYIDKTGKVVIPCKYTYAAPFSEGFAAVNVMDKQNLWGFIDKTGKEVVEPKLYTENGIKYGIIGFPGLESTFYDGSAYISRFLNEGSKDNFVPNVYYRLTVDAKVADWAREQVDLAAAKGLMPDCFGDDFTVNITRAEFAALSVALYEAMSGEAAPVPGENPFTDADDPAILQANALGVVKGKGDGKFAPDDLVTRQEAALMLSRVYTKLGGEIPQVAATTFADDSEISDWAGLKDAIAFMAGHQILNGVGNNRFDPKGNASVQEAMVIALRMFENLK